MESLASLFGFKTKQRARKPVPLSKDPFKPVVDISGSFGQAQRGSQILPQSMSNCTACSRPCASFMKIDCGHLFCLSCYHRAVQLTDPNQRAQGFFSCGICDRLVRIADQVRFSENTLPAAPNQPSPSQKELAVDAIRSLGKSPKFCNECSAYLNSTEITYCTFCRRFTCKRCGELHASATRNHSFEQHDIYFISTDDTNAATLAEPLLGATTSGYADCTASSEHKQISTVYDMLQRPLVKLEDMHCASHPDQPVQFSCMTCESPAICAKCCVGPNSPHLRHSVMDIASAWSRIEYEITGSEAAQRSACQDELQRLVDLSNTCLMQISRLIKLQTAEVKRDRNDSVAVLRQCFDTSADSVQMTYSYVKAELLDKVIEDHTLRRLASYLFGVPSILRSQGLPVVLFWRRWKAATDIKDTPFPVPIDDLQLKCEWFEALLARSRWTSRWLEEAACLQYINAERLERILGQMKIRELANSIDFPSSTYESSDSSEPDMIMDPHSILNPLANKNFISMTPAYPPSTIHTSGPRPETHLDKDAKHAPTDIKSEPKVPSDLPERTKLTEVVRDAMKRAAAAESSASSSAPVYSPHSSLSESSSSSISSTSESLSSE